MSLAKIIYCITPSVITKVSFIIEGGTKLHKWIQSSLIQRWYRIFLLHSSPFLILLALLPLPWEHLFSPLPSNKSLQQESWSQTLIQTQLLILSVHKLKLREVIYIQNFFFLQNHAASRIGKKGLFYSKSMCFPRISSGPNQVSDATV